MGAMEGDKVLRELTRSARVGACVGVVGPCVGVFGPWVGVGGPLPQGVPPPGVLEICLAENLLGMLDSAVVVGVGVSGVVGVDMCSVVVGDAVGTDVTFSPHCLQNVIP